MKMLILVLLLSSCSDSATMNRSYVISKSQIEDVPDETED